jgi:hypothetical protein
MVAITRKTGYKKTKKDKRSESAAPLFYSMLLSQKGQSYQQ